MATKVKAKQDVADAPAVRVACVDDEPGQVKLLATYLRAMGCEVETYTDPMRCLAALKEQPVDIVVTDLSMPGMDGLSILDAVKRQGPNTDVVIVTGTADKQAAIQAVKLGAFDFFEKPINRDELVAAIERTVRYRALIRERDRYAEQVSTLSKREAERWGINAFVGKSRAIKNVLGDIRKLQESTRTSVLITGESGTGKELVARAIHFGSARRSGPFIPVNCAAIPHELAESILFGHAKGSFTGATADKKGALEMAHKGTLFLDEIGDMSASVQTKLLRVLEDGVVVPVGKSTGTHVDVRVVAATNSDIQGRLRDGLFRPDLYYRLAGFAIHISPLRERKEDIPLLAEHFLRLLSAEMGVKKPQVSPKAQDILMAHSFPGNARELRNVIERALIESGGNHITEEHIRLLAVSHTACSSATAREAGVRMETHDLPLNIQEAESVLVGRAMTEAGGNVSWAARLLGISRTRLYRKLAQPAKACVSE